MISRIGRWIKRLREHRYWGLSIITWWLLLQGGTLLLIFSFGLFSPTGPSFMLLLPGVATVVAGVRLRMRDPLGWWMAVWIFALELAFVVSSQLEMVVDLFTGRAPVYVDLWVIIVSLLLAGGPLIYLTRPKIRGEF